MWLKGNGGETKQTHTDERTSCMRSHNSLIRASHKSLAQPWKQKCLLDVQCSDAYLQLWTESASASPHSAFLFLALNPGTHIGDHFTTQKGQLKKQNVSLVALCFRMKWHKHTRLWVIAMLISNLPQIYWTFSWVTEKIISMGIQRDLVWGLKEVRHGPSELASYTGKIIETRTRRTFDPNVEAIREATRKIKHTKKCVIP